MVDQEVPLEVWRAILLRLDPRDCARVAQVCKLLHRAARDEWLWKENCFIHFPKEDFTTKPKDESITWFQLFAGLWRNERDLRSWHGVYDELWSDVHELETVTLHEDPATHVIRVSHCVPALEQNWTISAVKHSGVVLSFVTQGGHSNWKFRYSLRKTREPGLLRLYVQRLHPDHERFLGFLIKTAIRYQTDDLHPPFHALDGFDDTFPPEEDLDAHDSPYFCTSNVPPPVAQPAPQPQAIPCQPPIQDTRTKQRKNCVVM